jgi:hypothetical protein
VATQLQTPKLQTPEAAFRPLTPEISLSQLIAIGLLCRKLVARNDTKIGMYEEQEMGKVVARNRQQEIGTSTKRLAARTFDCLNRTRIK